MIGSERKRNKWRNKREKIRATNSAKQGVKKGIERERGKNQRLGKKEHVELRFIGAKLAV